jgi:hypothetical protein
MFRATVARRVASVKAAQGRLSFFAYFLAMLPTTPHRRNSARSSSWASCSTDAVSIASASPANASIGWPVT